MTMMPRVVLLSLLIIVLCACAPEPAYTPDVSVLAAREQAEYDDRQDRIQNAWLVGMVFISAILIVVVILVVFLSRVGYRIQAAGARKAEIENERLEFVALGDGKAYHIPTKTVIDTTQARQIAAPIMPAQQLRPPETLSDNKYIAFLQRAAHVHPEGWHGKTIPGHRALNMRGETWEAMIRPLKEDGYIETSPTGTFITEGGDLMELYNLLMANPITE